MTVTAPLPTPSDLAAHERACFAAGDRLVELAGHLNMINAQITDVIADVLEHELWHQGAVKSPEQFLAWKMGVSPNRATELVRVARARRSFPTLMSVFDQGQLSIDQIAVCVRAPAWADEQIVDIARVCTVSKLRHQLRSKNFVDDPTDTHASGDTSEPDAVTEPAPPAEPDDVVSFGPSDDGRWTIRGNFDLATGSRIEAAITERRDALFNDGNEHVTWADAVTDCFARSLDAVESRPRRDHYRTWLHLDVTDGEATTTNGWRIPMDVADRILCNGIVQPVWERDGIPFSIGRAQHIVPERTRRFVERRDGGCRVPGCDAHRFVEVHHIIHWLDGGPSDSWNVLGLCPYHHRLHHQGRLGISGNADDPFGVVFTDADGRVIEPRCQPVTPTGPPPTPSRPYDHPLRGRVQRHSNFIHPNILKRRAEAARRAWQTIQAA